MANLFKLDSVGYAVGEKSIVHDISMIIDSNEYVTITGPSGSGKSTLLRLLATLLTPTNGNIFFNGKDQSSYEKINYRRQVSYCSQQPTLFGETVRDNLEFPFLIRKQHFDQKRAEAALSSVDLNKSMLNNDISSLSGGERQRIALIRNLLFKPQVLLLDEISTGLDLATKNIVHELIDHFNQQEETTIISVTHDDTEIEHAKRIINIVDGTIMGRE